MHKFYKHLIAGVSALVMCLSAVPLSASAEITSTSTSVQQVSNQDVYNQVLALGFDEDEAQYIVDNVDTNDILSILGTNSGSVSRSITTTSLDHATYSNVSTWNNDNSCGSVASAIFLIYYSCYHYPEISYTSPYNLYLSLKPYMETSSNARISTIDSRTQGLKQYLNDHDNSDIADDVRSFAYDDASASTTANFKKMCLLIVAHLNRDEPVIVSGKYNSTDSIGHVAVIESIRVVQDSSGNIDTNNTYIYVNDGWGGTNQQINFKNFVSYSGRGITYLF